LGKCTGDEILHFYLGSGSFQAYKYPFSAIAFVVVEWEFCNRTRYGLKAPGYNELLAGGWQRANFGAGMNNEEHCSSIILKTRNQKVCIITDCKSQNYTAMKSPQPDAPPTQHDHSGFPTVPVSIRIGTIRSFKSNRIMDMEPVSLFFTASWFFAGGPDAQVPQWEKDMTAMNIAASPVFYSATLGMMYFASKDYTGSGHSKMDRKPRYPFIYSNTFKTISSYQPVFRLL
jgi:hypothetical protein